MSKNDLKAYSLIKYKESIGDKSAKLILNAHVPSPEGYGKIDFCMGSIYLDEEDTDYLLQKYKISELRMKELEQGEMVKKLSEIQEAIKILREDV